MHYELISTSMCEFTTGQSPFAYLLLTDIPVKTLTIVCLAATEENTWQWLSVETSTVLYGLCPFNVWPEKHKLSLHLFFVLWLAYIYRFSIPNSI